MFIHSSIFINFFILIRVTKDMEHIPLTLGERWEYTQCYCTHTHYKAKCMLCMYGTPDHHSHMWAFPKQSTKLYRMHLYAVALQFLFHWK